MNMNGGITMAAVEIAANAALAGVLFLIVCLAVVAIITAIAR